MADDVVTAAQIASHLECPRKYEFEHERPVSPPKESLDRRDEHRRVLLRGSIIAGLRLDDASPDERTAAACDRFEELRRSSPSSYLVDEQARYDGEVVAAAIAAYFDADGHEHGERLVAADETVGYERGGVRYETTIDAVVERDGGYLALDYRPNLHGVLNVGWYDDNVRRFEEGEGFYPRQIGSLVRAAIVIRGLMNEHGLGPNYDFAYVSLLEDSRPAYDAPGEIYVDVEQRHFGGAYDEERADVNALVADRAAALLSGETDPREWQFDEIIDSSCSYCAYQNACPDYLESELSFTDRHRAADESPGRPQSPEFSSEESR
ncbi:hypothetical protein [Halorussus ruber]|uniref:hypothetical protein n=1 Tax=Halorussus ruber TaxID=1126238 RepID=UPI001B2FE83E|nr:hypothetical protein [Halorussus ruber]